MFPKLQLGVYSISTFSFMIALAIVVSAAYIIWQAGRRGLSRYQAAGLSLVTAISGLVGMRIFHILVESPQYYWDHPDRLLRLSSGGFVSWGAIVGVLVAAVIYLKFARLPRWRYLDAFALGFPIILFFVRIGCLGAGCCYGKPVESFPFYLVFTDPRSAAARYYPGMPLHATQIYSMLNAVILFVGLHLIAKRQRFDGQVLMSFMIGYGFLRGVVEFLRGDIDRGVYWNIISTGQVMSLLLIVFGLWGYRTLRRIPAA